MPRTECRKFAVLGWPVEHSVSPCMHSAAYAALGLRASYEAIPVRPGEVAAVAGGLVAQGYSGWNVTVPHKQEMLETVAEAAPEALLSQSVNTVSVDPDGRLKGHSTDGYGLIAALDEAFGLGPAGLRTVLVGAGGAARACAVALVSAGAARLVIANRTQARGQALRDLLTPLGVSRGTEIEAVGLQELAVALAKGDVDVLVQATSLGLRADDPAPFPPALLPPGLPVMDMIYRETALLAGARNQGCPCADGRAMLLHQGARSFEIWFGFPPPLDAMRSGLEQALRAGTPS